ncbi:MAG: hypothetical protein K8R85_01040 [Bacteroidetes bacterium]|nr:hypothetical protein [Bacteroidota bacterium]
MRTYCIYLLLLLFVLVSHTSIAQDEPDQFETKIAEESPPRQKQYYLFSPRVSVTVPHPIGNKSFKKSFVGIYEVNAGLNLMLYKGLFAGVTFKNGLLKITENKIPDLNADMAINNAALKLGSDFYVNSKNTMLLSAAVSIGQNNTKYSSFKSKTLNEKPLISGFRSSYIEPEVNLFFLTEANFGIGATLTYSIIKRNFDPYELCLDEWSQFGKDNSGPIRYLSFGFGFYYGFSKKTKK